MAGDLVPGKFRVRAILSNGFDCVFDTKKEALSMDRLERKIRTSAGLGRELLRMWYLDGAEKKILLSDDKNLRGAMKKKTDKFTFFADILHAEVPPSIQTPPPAPPLPTQPPTCETDKLDIQLNVRVTGDPTNICAFDFAKVKADILELKHEVLRLNQNMLECKNQLAINNNTEAIKNLERTVVELAEKNQKLGSHVPPTRIPPFQHPSTGPSTSAAEQLAQLFGDMPGPTYTPSPAFNFGPAHASAFKYGTMSINNFAPESTLGIAKTSAPAPTAKHSSTSAPSSPFEPPPRKTVALSSPLAPPALFTLSTPSSSLPAFGSVFKSAPTQDAATSTTPAPAPVVTSSSTPAVSVPAVDPELEAFKMMMRLDSAERAQTCASESEDESEDEPEDESECAAAAPWPVPSELGVDWEEIEADEEELLKNDIWGKRRAF